MAKTKKKFKFNNIFKEYFIRLGLAINVFWKNHGAVISASSTFFAILSSLPLLIMVVSLVGFMMGDYRTAQTQVIDYVKLAFPNVSPWFFATIKNIISNNIGPMQEWSWFNFLVLLWAASGFINSIFYGIHLLSQSQVHRSWSIPLKSVIVLILTVVAAFLMIFLDNNLLFWMIILLYFTVLYYFIIGSSIDFKDAFLGSFTFVLSFFISKLLFGLYIVYGRQTMIRNFGDFYAMVVAVMWVYFLMIAFFLSASVSLSKLKK